MQLDGVENTTKVRLMVDCAPSNFDKDLAKTGEGSAEGQGGGKGGDYFGEDLGIYKVACGGASVLRVVGAGRGLAYQQWGVG